MRLIDKIALNRLISTILDFILKIVKMLSPKDPEKIDAPKPWKPRWRRK